MPEADPHAQIEALRARRREHPATTPDTMPPAPEKLQRAEAALLAAREAQRAGYAQGATEDQQTKLAAAVYAAEDRRNQARADVRAAEAEQRRAGEATRIAKHNEREQNPEGALAECEHAKKTAEAAERRAAAHVAKVQQRHDTARAELDALNAQKLVLAGKRDALQTGPERRAVIAELSVLSAQIADAQDQVAAAKSDLSTAVDGLAVAKAAARTAQADVLYWQAKVISKRQLEPRIARFLSEVAGDIVAIDSLLAEAAVLARRERLPVLGARTLGHEFKMWISLPVVAERLRRVQDAAGAGAEALLAAAAVPLVSK